MFQRNKVSISSALVMTVTRSLSSLFAIFSTAAATITTTTAREQGLICCFISHFTCHILQQAGPPTHQSHRPARRNVMQMLPRSVESEEEGNHIHSCTRFLLKGKQFPQWDSNETSFFFKTGLNSRKVPAGQQGEVKNKEAESTL